jgi:hypothetical protein
MAPDDSYRTTAQAFQEAASNDHERAVRNATRMSTVEI